MMLSLPNFNLADWLKIGSTLIVGDGNFSFSRSLAQKPGINVGNLTATELEPESALSVDGQQNVAWLRQQRVTVVFGVDATNLAGVLGPHAQYDNIVWNFPFAESLRRYRELVNQQLLRRFFQDAERCLTSSGHVIVTLRDYYKNRWKLLDGAAIAGLTKVAQVAYQFGGFPGYNPITTMRNVKPPNFALSHTWIFWK